MKAIILGTLLAAALPAADYDGPGLRFLNQEQNL
jgi:hypothetical protein